MGVHLLFHRFVRRFLPEFHDRSVSRQSLYQKMDSPKNDSPLRPAVQTPGRDCVVFIVRFSGVPQRCLELSGWYQYDSVEVVCPGRLLRAHAGNPCLESSGAVSLHRAVRASYAYFCAFCCLGLFLFSVSGKNLCMAGTGNIIILGIKYH